MYCQLELDVDTSSWSDGCEAGPSPELRDMLDHLRGQMGRFVSEVSAIDAIGTHAWVFQCTFGNRRVEVSATWHEYVSLTVQARVGLLGLVFTGRTERVLAECAFRLAATASSVPGIRVVSVGPVRR